MLLCTENWATLVLNQLNRWVRCHSVERCRTFWKKGCCWAVRPFTITLTQLAVFIGWHQQDQNTSNGEENHSEMASGPVLYSKWGKSISNCFSVWRFRSHMGRNTLKYVRDSRMECCQEGSNNLHFNELWKALASLSIICPKKFLQQSWEHLFLIQQPEAESIWRFSTWWKII